MLTHPVLAAAYAQLGRQQDADGERAIVRQLWPFLDARTFDAQFGTQEARDHMLDGLMKAGFHRFARSGSAAAAVEELRVATASISTRKSGPAANDTRFTVADGCGPR
jgi:hypothetical protein